MKITETIFRRYWYITLLLFWTIYTAFTVIMDAALRIDFVIILVLVVILSFLNEKTRLFLKISTPFILAFFLYDVMRYLTTSLRGEINVAEPYLIEKALFGIQTDSGILTPNEYFIQNNSTFFDLYFGFVYIAYFLFPILFVMYLFYKKDINRCLIVTWGFLLVNAIGYITYFIYPAAPPWYVLHHGFGPADTSIPGNPAEFYRFDQLIGIDVFKSFYTRNSNVFAAIPSLHVTYTFIAFLSSIKKYKANMLLLGLLTISLNFAAVYSNHHYVIDVILGDLYALIVFLGIYIWFRRKHSYNSFKA